MNKKMQWLVGINLVLLSLVGIRSLVGFKHSQQDISEDPVIKQVDARMDKDGDMMLDESKRDWSVLKQLGVSGTISDADLDWGINLTRTCTSRPMEGALAQAMILMEWCSVKHWTPTQANKILQAAPPLLKSHSQEIKIMAIQALLNLKDVRAVAPLLPVLDDPIPAVRDKVTRALATMGYKQPS